MGAEAHIELARINDGLHTLDDARRRRYVFEVSEPVAVVWANARPFGRTVLYTTWHLDLDAALAFADPSDADALPMAGQDGAMGAVVVARREWLRTHVPEVWGRWQYDETPGCEPWEGLLAAWDRIRPGVWCVAEYHESGCGDGRFDGLAYRPEGLVLGNRVKWKIWT